MAFAFAGLALSIIHTAPMSALRTMSTAKPGGRHGDGGVLNGLGVMVLTLRTAYPQDYADLAVAGGLRRRRHRSPGFTPQPSHQVVSEVRS